MGAGLSEEEVGPHKERQCSPTYLHWLLNDAGRIQEAFRPVWQACCADRQTSAPRARVLEVMLRVVQEFERAEELLESEAGDAGRAGSGKTARHLARVVEMLPERLSRPEALQLFRTALLSVQAALAIKAGVPALHPGRGEDMEDLATGQKNFSPNLSLDSGSSALGLLGFPGGSPDTDWARIEEARRQDSSISLFQSPATPPTSPTGKSEFGPVEPSVALRAITRAEDVAVASTGRPQRPHPALAAAPLFPAPALPSRQELEVENEQLASLTALIDASCREELLVVRALEEEVRLANGQGAGRAADGRQKVRGSDGALYNALEAKAEATEQEVVELEAQVRARDQELVEWEAELAGQRKDISSLLEQRAEEEADTSELSQEARELSIELKACRRECTELEGEIASEESRAAALREAFEGRRARFTSAEMAARNAELSTMRATRRRIAAEASARQEAQAVEEAHTMRQQMAAESTASIEALKAEVEEVRSRGYRAFASLNANAGDGMVGRQAGGRAQNADGALSQLRLELAQAERERDDELFADREAASEMAQLEVARARLEGQLAGREGELRAAQRRALRTIEAARPLEPAAATDRAAAATAAEEAELGQQGDALRSVEARVAGVKYRHAELEDELRAALASDGNRQRNVGADAIEEESAAEASWRHAREIGAELGEARAALVRRRAQEQSGNGENVVSALREALQIEEKAEAESSFELDEVRNRILAGMEEKDMPPGHDGLSRGGGSSLRGPGVHLYDALEARVSALEDEFKARSRALLRAEERLRDMEASQPGSSPASGGAWPATVHRRMEAQEHFKRDGSVNLMMHGAARGTDSQASPGPVLSPTRSPQLSRTGMASGITVNAGLRSPLSGSREPRHVSTNRLDAHRVQTQHQEPMAGREAGLEQREEELLRRLERLAGSAAPGRAPLHPPAG